MNQSKVYVILGGTGGSIVLMSSAAARVGMPSHEAIAAAKAGVVDHAVRTIDGGGGIRL